MHRTKRESSSELGPILAAKNIDDLLDYLNASPEGSVEAQEATDELVRRAALYTELKAENAILKASKGYRQVMLAPDSQRAQ